MHTIKVSLGGKEYEINQLQVKSAKVWRKKFAEPLENILGAVQSSADALKKAFDDDTQVNAGELVSVLGQNLLAGVGHVLLGSMDLVLDMVYEYAPNLKAASEEIEENAYDDEIMLALVEVLKLAYPFGQIVNLVRPGQQRTATKKS